MIVYFADRYLNILGQASTKLPGGMMIADDLKTEDVETGVAVFECDLPFDADTRAKTEAWAAVGNYLLRHHEGETELYTIIEAESDTKKQTVYIYAEDAGMDLLNERFGAYEADKAYPISHYVEMFAGDSGFQIGRNEAAKLSRKLSWDGEATAAERIASVAAQFDGCEISFSFDIKGLAVVAKYINIYKKRGKDVGIELRLDRDIDRIVTTKSINNLATALVCTGGTPEDENPSDDKEPVPITLKGYKYDDGDFYVDGDTLKSRVALKKWNRYLWRSDPDKQAGGHIVRPFSYETLSQAELCAHAITELKKLREMEVNYKVDISKLPENVKIGDRVNIVDDAGGLYLSSRILALETSVANETVEATIGEYLIKGSGINAKVAELAAQFAKTSQSAARALSIARAAKTNAAEAQAKADAAATEAENALAKADEATTAANTATASAEAAQTAANNAQAAVDIVEEDVAGLETTVANAQAAAEQAQAAAETAQAKAEESHTAATNAQQKAEEAATAAGNAQTKADSAEQKATSAQSAAEQAQAEAEEAATTAAAAKLDAENAQKDIDALGENLTTLESTMQADYARKTDLTEATASLQTQITQNAAEISSTASRVQTIDETANDAKEQAEAAQTAADAAQAQADQATADAQAAQTAADEASAAARAAQSEADTAKAAAATAQSVADKAEADLEAAKADLATVTSRVDATEADITAAQEAVNAAQSAADKANADAQAAATKAAEAQETADTAVTNAATAKEAADDAADKATIAQATADEAKGNAAAAQATADEAKANAATAQATADTAKTNAATAQTKANEAAAAAAAAQSAADDADAKAAAAQSDLDTAKQNLANVTSRVDATEEEVAAAQAAVETAQAAAYKAKADAATAQSTADTAKANAATAQTAADNAKSAADAAQADADAAQAAADKAQADVDALAVRVTSAETKITQNSEQIALMATKEEVTQTLGGYYTKTEADAAIQVKANEITQTVSQTYTTKEEFNDLEIGGRNLYTGSADFSTDWVNSPLWSTDGVDSRGNVRMKRSDAWSGLVQEIQAKPGETYILSCNVLGDGTATYWFFASEYDETATQIKGGGLGAATIAPTEETRVYSTPYTVENECLLRIRVENSISGASLWVSSLKLEKGNKATDWTPAPEDVDEQINDGDAAVQTSVTEQMAQMVQDTEGFILQALESYAEDADLDALKNTISAELKLLSDNMTVTISRTETDIASTNSRLDAMEKLFAKYFVFGDNGLTISSTDSSSTLQLDNVEGVVFRKSGVVQSKMIDDNFYTGNIFVEVTKQARFGGLAAVPRSARKLTWMEVGN